ncbi:MAG: MBL fold metallo-hydrolase [Chthoniobacteraceae bacterium]
MISVRYRHAVELPEHHLWLDSQRAKDFAFVSHAHSDHLGAHEAVIASPGTIAFMRERMPGVRTEHVLEFGETRAFDDFRITLLPAGHILGSAQSFIESDAGTLLYTGDFKLRAGLSAELAQWRKADTLIMETTFGLPRYVMPPAEEVLAQVVAFCRTALDDRATPVLFAYSLGKAQELICTLLAAGLTPMLQDSTWTMTEIYRELNPAFPAGSERFDARSIAGKVIIFPPTAKRTDKFQRLPQRRTAVVTGWALDPATIYRYKCDAAFALSDHADYTELLRYVELVQPRRVLTLHGFAAEFASDLRARGVEAWAINEANQLDLALG